MSSMIGYERRFNPYMQIEDLDSFRQAMTDGAPPVPTHYPRMKNVNAEGPQVLGNLPRVPPLPADAFAEAISDGRSQLLDTRYMLSFGAGHIPGALNIGAEPELSVWAGWLLDPERPIYLVLENDAELARVVTLFWRTGFTEFGGYLADGMGAWRERGYKLSQISQMSVHELRDAGGKVQPLDVREDDEWGSGHVPNARRIFLGELGDRLNELDRSQPHTTYCASGFRASAAASVLAANGFEDVHNVPGSWKAWTSADFETMTPDK